MQQLRKTNDKEDFPPPKGTFLFLLGYLAAGMLLWFLFYWMLIGGMNNG
ncbi:hypothetical protein KZZ20_10920 [Methylacidiphilum fumariolicum]|nr:hypothetical protein [Candidatus Methylacidiphilum fumarolicum]MBW6416015.1 hypothetical protein [Candidatus Methylacidiphilum fumarolicum]